MLHAQQIALLVVPFPFAAMLALFVVAFPTQVTILPIYRGRTFKHTILEDIFAPLTTVTKIGVPFALTLSILQGTLRSHLTRLIIFCLVNTIT